MFYKLYNYLFLKTQIRSIIKIYKLDWFWKQKMPEKKHIAKIRYIQAKRDIKKDLFILKKEKLLKISAYSLSILLIIFFFIFAIRQFKTPSNPLNLIYSLIPGSILLMILLIALLHHISGGMFYIFLAIIYFIVALPKIDILFVLPVSIILMLVGILFIAYDIHKKSKF